MGLCENIKYMTTYFGVVLFIFAQSIIKNGLMKTAKIAQKYLLLLVILLLATQSKAQVQAGFNINYVLPNCAPEVITLQNTSTGSNLTYQWNFGVVSGVNSTQNSPATSYINCGVYTITLTATDLSGNSSTVTHTATINCSPHANFSVSSSSGCNPLTVQFTNLSTPGTGTITSYVWDFGDGTSGTGANPIHVYNTTGCKSVTLIVTNSNGCTDDTTISNVVCVSLPPVAAFTSSAATACAAPLTVNFTGTGSGGLPPYTYHWSFAGGSPATSNAANPSSTFSAPGYHAVTLVVVDANGCSDTLTLPQYVFVGNYNSSFTVSATSGCAPLNITAGGPGNGVASWQWTATGATPSSSTLQNPSFSYPTPGTYQICLQTTFIGGCTVSNCTTVVVHPTPVAQFTSPSNLNQCQAPVTINFQNQSSGGNTYAWTFTGGAPASSSAANPPSVVYNACGTYNVSLMVTNSFGCSSTYSQSNYVNLNCPVASFTSPVTGGCAPLTVTFNSAASTGGAVQWKWNFGTTGNPNLVQSTQQNPTFTFTTPGCYDIRLVIINAQGCTDTLLQSSYICVGTHPNANFAGAPLVNCAYQGVTFTNQSTGTFPYTTYNWDFENLPFSSESNQTNPSHNYSDTGWFDVTLIACNFGCCDTQTIYHYVHIMPPIAQINTSFSCSTPLDRYFDGTSSIGASTYSWTFPSGTPATSSAPTVNVHWTTSGDRTVKLVVWNSVTGCTDTMTKLVKIRNLQPGFTCPQNGCAPFTVHFTNTTIDAVSYKWNVYNSAGTSVFTSTNTNPNATLTVPGVYSVRLIATDVNNCKDTLYQPNYINVYGMTVTPTAAAYNPCGPVQVVFNQSTSSVNSSPVSYSWNFGDPTSGGLNTSSLPAPAHMYHLDGTYSVTLDVTDNHGCVSHGVLASNIIIHKPHADFVALDTTICLHSQACFFNNSTGATLSFNWAFGNGQTSQQANPCETYNTLGYFTVRLIATDAYSCKDTLTRPQYIHVVTVTAAFSADSAHTSCPPLPVHFTSLCTGTDPGSTYLWNFGDGSTAAIPNPFHIYTHAGYFNVSLIVTNSYGCVDTLQMDSLIHIGGPTATYTTTLTGNCLPVQACFTGTSNSVSYTWNFGDGTVLTNAPVSVCYNYTSTGTYTPQVILSDGQGCTYAYTLPSFSIVAPQAYFVYSPHDICQAGNVQFTDSSFTNNTPITNFHWDFGDPGSGANNISGQVNPTHYYSGIGNYVVSFSITNNIGCVSTYYDTVYITPRPIAAFILSDSIICPGTFVNCTNQSQSQSAITSLNWDFGDPGSGVNNTTTYANPSHLYQAPGTYNITLIVTAANACSDTATHPVHVLNQPLNTTVTGATICLGDTATLGASGAALFNWSPATGLSATNVSNPQAFPTVTTQYQVVATATSGCTDTSLVTVTVNPVPVITVTGADTTCSGSSSVITAAGAIHYLWTPATYLANDTMASTTASPIQTTTYTVTGTNSFGCTATNQVVIQVFPSPAAAVPDTFVCLGNSVGLHAGNGFNYIWSPSTGLDNPNSANPVCTVQSSISYLLTMTDTHGCTTSDSVRVLVKPLPTVSVAEDTVKNCFGSNAQLFASGAQTYVWTPAVWLSNPNIAAPSVNAPAHDTTYFVYGTDLFGCKNYDSVRIQVIKPFVAKIGADTNVCIGTSVQLEASGSAHFHWFPTQWLNNPNISNPVSTPQGPITYSVSISDNVCFTDTETVHLDVLPLPTVHAGPDQTEVAGQSVLLSATGTGSSYSWSPVETLDCPDCANTRATPQESFTTYTVTTTDANGCRAEDSLVIRVLCEDDAVFIPDAFTPNNDHHNDIFYVRSLGLKSLQSFRVYDRWGALLFETDDINQGWDGTYKGVALAPAVFVYVIDAICSTGDRVKLQGNVTLIR